jgi:serine/threonine protein kinase
VDIEAAAIYGLEKSGDFEALVLELVEGETLAEKIAAGPVAVDEALAIARQIADALEAAHEKGIVHRDLKPANVKITPDGKVKMLDFGLAKALAGDVAGPQRKTATAISSTPTSVSPAGCTCAPWNGRSTASWSTASIRRRRPIPTASWCTPRRPNSRRSVSSHTAPAGECAAPHARLYFKQTLDRESRAELLGLIEDHAIGRVLLVVPLTLFGHHIRRCSVPYLADQVYLRPHPVELMLRNHV